MPAASVEAGHGVTGVLTDTALTLRERVGEFLAYEADLTDRHQFDDWLSLWTPDAIYWVPSNEDDYDVRTHLSIIYDDHERLQERCVRLSAEGAHSQDPRSRLCRTIGCVRVVSPDADGFVSATATMVLVEVRSGVKTTYAARLEYQLVDHDGTFRMRRKKVVLVDNDEPLGNVTFLL